MPLLIGQGITSGIGTSIGGITSSVSYYQKLSKDKEQVSKFLVTLQDQVNSLAAVVLQNRRGLYLLTIEKEEHGSP